MIVVTGTKRSGTSMWMQILVNGGFQYIGEAFPQDWGRVIKDANPEGFYESTLAGGVWWRSNPSPKTGAWLHPDSVKQYAVKVFIPGVVRTDISYLTRVVATVREWRQYEASLRRLFRIQSENKGEEFDEKKVAPLPPGYDWWMENFDLVRDIATRRYAVHVLSYGSLLADPEQTVGKVFDWIGGGDKQKAARIVDPKFNTQRKEEAQRFTSEHAEVFDEYYSRIHTGKPLDQAFIAKMNETHNKIVEHIKEIAPGYLRRRYALDWEDYTPEVMEKEKKRQAALEKRAKAAKAGKSTAKGGKSTAQGSKNTAKAAVAAKGRKAGTSTKPNGNAKIKVKKKAGQGR